MPLFEVAIIEPALVARHQGDLARDEQIVLAPTPVLAKDEATAKTLAILAAGKAHGDAETGTDSKRWEVLARPFAKA